MVNITLRLKEKSLLGTKRIKERENENEDLNENVLVQLQFERMPDLNLDQNQNKHSNHNPFLLLPGHILLLSSDSSFAFPILFADDKTVTIIISNNKKIENEIKKIEEMESINFVVTGKPLNVDEYKKGPVLIQELDIISFIFLLKKYPELKKEKYLRIIFETKNLFFNPVPSKYLTPELPTYLTAALPLLEDLGVISRICHPTHPGCYEEDGQSLCNLWKNRLTANFDKESH